MSFNSSECSASEFLSNFIDKDDKICFGNVKNNNPENTVSDAAAFEGKRDKYFTPNAFDAIRNNDNILKFNANFNDLDFVNELGERDPQLALEKAPVVVDRLKEKDLHFAVVFSGRGLQSIIPSEAPDIDTWKNWNWLVNYGLFEGYPIDKDIAKIPCSYLRLPNTVNSKSGLRARVLFHNFDQTVDMKAHNAAILRKCWQEYEKSGGDKDEDEALQKLDRGIVDYRTAHFQPSLLSHMAALDWEIVYGMNFIKTEDRELNDTLMPNLGSYAVIFNKRAEVESFLSAIDGDVANLNRWLKKENLEINYQQLWFWAKKHFPNTKVEALAEVDWGKFQFSSAYWKIYTQDAHTHFDSLDELRREMNGEMERRLLENGVHFIFAEMGAGKTFRAEKWAEGGKRVLMLVPYTSLRVNMPKIPNLFCYTFDTLVPKTGSKAGVERLRSLIDVLSNCDSICIDEAHTLDTLYQLKPKVIDAVNRLIQSYSHNLPVFLLSGTPSVNQISGSVSGEYKSFERFLLKRERKPLTLVSVDKANLLESIKRHNKVLFFVDNVSDTMTVYAYLKTLGLPHKILRVTSLNDTAEKIGLQEEIERLDKFIVVASSAFSSGLNLPLDTVVLCNRIVTHQSLHQVINRLRIVCKPDQENRVYYLHHSPFKANWKTNDCDIKGDIMMTVSKKLLIKHLGKVYNLKTIDSDYERMKGLSELNSIETMMNCVRLTTDVFHFCREFNIFKIPWDAFNRLKLEGFDLDSWFVTHSFFDAKRTKSDIDTMLEKGFIKKKMRLAVNGQSTPQWIYCHLIATMEALNSRPDPKAAMEKLKLKTLFSDLASINQSGKIELDLKVAWGKGIRDPQQSLRDSKIDGAKTKSLII